MYPELKHFKQMKKEFEENVSRAEKEWTYLHKQKERTSKEYEDLLNQYGLRNSKVTMEILTESKNEYLQALEKEREALEHLDSLKEHGMDRLNEYLKTVYSSRDRELTAAKKSMDKKIEQLQRLKAEYLMMVQHIQEMHAYRQTVEKETSEAVQGLQTSYLPKEILPPHPQLTRLEISIKDIQYVFLNGELPEEMKKYFRFDFEDSVLRLNKE